MHNNTSHYINSNPLHNCIFKRFDMFMLRRKVCSKNFATFPVGSEHLQMSKSVKINYKTLFRRDITQKNANDSDLSAHLI